MNGAMSFPVLRSSRTLYSMLPAALLAVGCMGQVDEKAATAGDEPVAGLEQAFTGNWNWALGYDSYVQYDIGSSNDRTCFLSGVTGNIQPTVFPVGCSTQTGAGLAIDSTTQDYKLYVDPACAHGTRGGMVLEAFSRCVNTVAGRTAEVTWNSFQPAQLVAAATANRRCFLTSVTTSTDYGGKGGFASNSDFVRVWNDGYNWYIGGSQPAGSMVWGTARCIDVNQDVGGWEWIAGDPGTRKDPLTNVGDANCFLTGIGGHLYTNDYSDGAYITKDTSTNQFYLNTKNGKTGWVDCVR